MIVVLLEGSPISTKELCSSVRVIIGFLVTLHDQGPACPVAQFGRTASSRKSLGSSLFFPFPNDGVHCALGNFQHSRNCFIPFPISMPPHNSHKELYGQFLGLHGRVPSLTCTVNCGTLSRKVCFFLNHVQLISPPPVGGGDYRFAP